MDLKFIKLSKKHTDDFLDFFDNRAFCNNPDWAGCYCRFFYADDESRWENRTAEQNRNEAAAEIACGRMNGYLAYEDGRVVGWCNADDVGNYSRIIADENIPEEPEIKKAAVVCFITEPEFRRKGIASGLLNTVCGDFAGKGYEYIEAYPRKKKEGDAVNYYGYLQMYRSAGFEIADEAEDFYIVRKKL